MAIPIKSDEEVKNTILSEINQSAPTKASFEENSPAYDIFIKPLKRAYTDEEIKIDFISRQRSLDEMELVVRDADYQERLRIAMNKTTSEIRSIISSSIDKFVSNYNKVRTAKKKARGYIRLYANSNSPLTFSSNQTIGDIENKLTFTTLSSVNSFTPALQSELGLYYVDIAIECTEAGSKGNLIPGRLRKLKSSIPGIIACNNINKTDFGSDDESDIALIDRTRTALKSKSSNVIEGIFSTTLTYPGIVDASLVFYGDELMKRKSRGALDIYVITEQKIQQAEFIVDSTAARYIYDVLEDETTFSIYPTIFSESDDLVFKLKFQPAITIIEVSYSSAPNGSFTTLDPGNYQLQRDTDGAFARSIKANDVLRIIAGTVPENSYIKIKYTYNRILKDLHALFSSTKNRIYGNDFLFKQGEELEVDLDIEAIFYDTDISSVKSTAESDLTKLFQGGTDSNNNTRLPYKLGQRLDKTDLLQVILNVIGIDRLNDFKAYVNGIEMSSYFEPNVSQYVRLNSINWIDAQNVTVKEITNKTSRI